MRSWRFMKLLSSKKPTTRMMIASVTTYFVNLLFRIEVAMLCSLPMIFVLFVDKDIKKNACL